MDYKGTKGTGSDRVATYSDLAALADITALSNATGNTSYPSGPYAFNALASSGYPTDGRLSGTRNGTLNSQILRAWDSSTSYTRYWINGSSAWSAWATAATTDITTLNLNSASLTTLIQNG